MFTRLSGNCVRVLTKKTHGKITKGFPRTEKYSLNNVPQCFAGYRSLHTTSRLYKVIPYILSDIGEGIKEVSVKEWFIKEGDHIEQFQNICEVQSDKASVTITSRYDGKVTKIYHKIDDIALVGKPLIDVDVQDEDPHENQSSEATNTVLESSSENDDSENGKNEDRVKVLATPSVRRIATQNKLSLADVPSTGKGGRVLKEDILKYLNISADDSNDVAKMKLKEQKPPSGKIDTKPTEQPKLTNFEVKQLLGEDKTVKVSGYTRVMIKTMSESLKIPHFAYCDEIDVTELMNVRALIKKAVSDAGISLSFMPFFIKAASLSLQQYPILNSSIDEKFENIIYKAAHNIGVAMDTPMGLVVPSIKNVQLKNILEIALELNRLQVDGAKGSLKTEDLAGGTFSLSNIGVIGGTYTKPIILSPQVAIGGLGKIQVLPRFDKDFNVVKAHIFNISWTADHRIIDGATMANFSNKWKFYIENPNHLMLNL